MATIAMNFTVYCSAKDLKTSESLAFTTTKIVATKVDSISVAGLLMNGRDFARELMQNCCGPTLTSGLYYSCYQATICHSKGCYPYFVHFCPMKPRFLQTSS